MRKGREKEERNRAKMSGQQKERIIIIFNDDGVEIPSILKRKILEAKNFKNFAFHLISLLSL